MQAMVDTVTVIIRTVGRPSLLRALSSLQAQGVPHLKVCLVDAAGQGLSTGAFSDSLPVEELNIDVVSRQMPLSRAVAAQAGLDAVQQGYALFLDDDDELLPGHLGKLFSALRESPSAAAYTGVVQMREGTQEVLATWDRAFEPWQLLAANALPIHAVMFDAARVHQAGIAFDPTLEVFEDWDFWLQVQSLGPMVHVPGISACYWVGESPQTQSDAQAALHGDARYSQVWRKWWGRVPDAWRQELLRAGRDEPLLRLQWKETERAREQSDEARRLAELASAQSEAARLLTEQARLQAEAAREQSEAAREQSEDARAQSVAALEQSEGARRQTEQALGQVRQQLADLSLVDQIRRTELAHAEAQMLGQQQQLSELREQVDLVRSQRDEARLAEQGVRLHLQAVLGSRSWKLMAPLRWWGRQARRLLRLRHADARRNLWWRLRYRSFPGPRCWRPCSQTPTSGGFSGRNSTGMPIARRRPQTLRTLQTGPSGHSCR